MGSGGGLGVGMLEEKRDGGELTRRTGTALQIATMRLHSCLFFFWGGGCGCAEELVEGAGEVGLGRTGEREGPERARR